jgi:hypothetical protein
MLEPSLEQRTQTSKGKSKAPVDDDSGSGSDSDDIGNIDLSPTAMFEPVPMPPTSITDLHAKIHARIASIQHRGGGSDGEAADKPNPISSKVAERILYFEVPNNHHSRSKDAWPPRAARGGLIQRCAGTARAPR